MRPAFCACVIAGVLAACGSDERQPPDRSSVEERAAGQAVDSWRVGMPPLGVND